MSPVPGSSMRRWLEAMRRGALDVLLPPICAACGSASDAPLCVGCRVPAPPALDAPPVGIDGWAAGAAYGGGAEAWIRRFKYPQPGLRGLDPAAEAVLRGWIRAAAEALPGRPDAVVPVPLHRERRRLRGFDPPRLLAEALVQPLGLPLHAELLVRVRDTPSQTGLGRHARRRNVRGAFAATGPAPERVWLVDDVVTTGATLQACARALRRAGASEIRAVCAASRPLAKG